MKIELFTQQEVVIIVCGAILIFIFIRIFFSSNKKDSSDSKPVTLKDLNTIFAQNKEIVQVGNHLDFISKSFNERRLDLEDLQEEIENTKRELLLEQRRVEFVKASPELKSLEDVKEEISKLEDIKKTFQEINRTQAKRFSIVLLIKLLKDLYKQLHNVELSTLDIEVLLKEYVDTDSDTDSSSGGKESSNNKKKLRDILNGPRNML